MIVRNIVNWSEITVKNFDYFNDYNDTRNYLTMFRRDGDSSVDEVIRQLDECNKIWWENCRKKIRENQF